jgi:hypothetical protein
VVCRVWLGEGDKYYKQLVLSRYIPSHTEVCRVWFEKRGEKYYNQLAGGFKRHSGPWRGLAREKYNEQNPLNSSFYPPLLSISQSSGHIV